MGEKKGGEGRGRQQLSDEINSAKALVLGLSIHLTLKCTLMKALVKKFKRACYTEFSDNTPRLTT